MNTTIDAQRVRDRMELNLALLRYRKEMSINGATENQDRFRSWFAAGVAEGVKQAIDLLNLDLIELKKAMASADASAPLDVFDVISLQQRKSENGDSSGPAAAAPPKANMEINGDQQYATPS